MCTATFIARQKGYCLGMNREEKLSRPTGFPPKKKKVNGRAVISPSEPGGGTWITVNDHGATLALINGYPITARVGGKPVSRGEVVNSVSTASSPDFGDAVLAGLPLNRINPFRLIGIYLATGEIVEWRWNLKQLVRKNHRWKTQLWSSSGFDEPTAQRVRSRTFQRTGRQHSAGSLNGIKPEGNDFLCLGYVEVAYRNPKLRAGKDSYFKLVEFFEADVKRQFPHFSFEPYLNFDTSQVVFRLRGLVAFKMAMFYLGPGQN